MDCKRYYPPYILQYDHVHGKKTQDISSLIKKAVSKQTILKEIKKCELVCGNCHTERTYQRSHGGVAQ